MSAINKMGLELEGAWKGKIRVPPFKDGKIKHDGSVRFTQPPDGFLHYGELVSEPMDPDALAQWGYDHCPTDANDSAGTHLHFSLKSNTMYATLLTPTFNNTLINVLIKFNDLYKDSDPETYNRFLSRIEGKNTYCRKEYNGLRQVRMDGRGPDRYSQVNYCFQLHGTIEIRVLPCTSNKEFLRDVVLLVRDVIESFVAREHVTKKVRFRRG